MQFPNGTREVTVADATEPLVFIHVFRSMERNDGETFVVGEPLQPRLGFHDLRESAVDSGVGPNPLDTFFDALSYFKVFLPPPTALRHPSFFFEK